MSFLSNIPDQIPWRERLSTLASYAIVSGMMACLGITILQIGQRLSGSQEGAYLVLVAFLVSLESMATHSSRNRFVLFSSEWLVYRLSEWIIILIFLKLALYLLVRGLDQLWVDLPLWRQNFGSYFFTSEYVGVILLAVLVWMLSAAFASDLAELGDDQDFHGEGMPEAQRSRLQVRQRIADLILAVGAVMVFFTALLRIDWQARWLQGRPPQGGFYNILVYFLLGLVLLSLTQYSLLRMRWRDENIPFSREIAFRWALYSFLFILGLVVISSLLPTGYSMGLLALGNYLIYLMMAFLRLLWFILLLPLYLLAYLVSLLLRSDRPDAPVLGDLNPPIPPPDPTPGEPVPWIEALKSLVFWLVFFGVILFSIRYFLQENQELSGRLRRVPFVQWLAQAWETLRGWLGHLNRRMALAVGSQLNRLRRGTPGNPSAEAWRFLNVGRLSPRQQVMFFYEAFLRRGREQGFPRRPSETPYEYSGTLRAKMPALEDDPTAREDVASLTDRFIEARYSRHEITPTHAGLARRAWQRIRHYLRRIEPGD